MARVGVGRTRTEARGERREGRGEERMYHLSSSMRVAMDQPKVIKTD